MKLLIDETLHWAHYMSPSVNEDELQNFHDDVIEWCNTATRLGCKHSVSCTEYGAEIFVYPQKCTLDEIYMNDLFYNFLTNLFKISLEYVFLGGKGCEFSMRLKRISNQDM